MLEATLNAAGHPAHRLDELLPWHWAAAERGGCDVGREATAGRHGLHQQPSLRDPCRDVGWGLPDPDLGGGPLHARKARLIDVLEDTGAKTLRYL
jgi:hypothetical protein